MWQSVVRHMHVMRLPCLYRQGSFTVCGVQGLAFMDSNVILEERWYQLMRYSLVHRTLLAVLQRSAAHSGRAKICSAAARRTPFVSHLDAAKMAQGSGCIDLTLSSDSGSPVPALKGTCTPFALTWNRDHTASLPVWVSLLGLCQQITTISTVLVQQEFARACCCDCLSLAGHQPWTMYCATF